MEMRERELKKQDIDDEDDHEHVGSVSLPGTGSIETHGWDLPELPFFDAL